jgi:hypothetical protein
VKIKRADDDSSPDHGTVPSPDPLSVAVDPHPGQSQIRGDRSPIGEDLVDGGQLEVFRRRSAFRYRDALSCLSVRPSGPLWAPPFAQIDP